MAECAKTNAGVPIPAFREPGFGKRRCAYSTALSGSDKRTRKARSARESAAKWHDLVILEAHAESFGGDILETGSAIVRVDLPCVVVPRGMDKANLDTIAIAWNGSIQSARAVHAALPLLQQARRIAILRVDDADAAGAIDRIEPDEFLGRHGLRCEHFDMRGRADDAGAALLAGAAQIFADLLVLGAYGTGRFSEWIFGGVTRHVLQHVTLPLFMRH